MWQNWAGDQACTPASRRVPTSVDEVGAVVRASAERGNVVRVVGAGHSFGDNCLTDGTLVSLDGLKGLQHVDRETGLVRVAAGTRLFELNEALDTHGLALANLGDINVQSVAGATSTGTHGTGAGLGNIATLVESLELVTADGSVRELSGEELRAARISVGALGVITAYTLRTVPSFRLEEQRGLSPLPALLAELDEQIERNDHFEFFVFPHASKALTKTLNRTNAPATAKGRLRAWSEETLIETYALNLLSRTGRRFPRNIPRLNRLVTALAGSSTKVGRSFDVFSSPRVVRFTESEWAFPRAACQASGCVEGNSRVGRAA